VRERLDEPARRVRLHSLLEAAFAPGAVRVPDVDPEITDVMLDSREVVPGALFACVRGANQDGHRFAADAVTNGAAALLVDHDLAQSVPQVVVSDVRAALGPVSAACFGHPSHRLTMAGVTGTNGKTTVTHLLGSILRAAGHRIEVMGTLSGGFTTPEAPELQRRLAGFVRDGVTAVAMEVSSHSLAMRRVDGTRFGVVVFTNLSPDHLDFHGTMEAYEAAKARLFSAEFAAAAVVCADDPAGRRLLDAKAIDAEPYGSRDASDVEVLVSAVAFTWRGTPLRVPIGGAVNVLNALAAATAAERLGIGRAEIAEGLRTVEAIPGRFEVVPTVLDERGVTAVVDYAHTPDALRAVLIGMRPPSPGRLVVVFGCGGDRDRAKRPLMGAVAHELADRVIITSDNPRGEDPRAIVDEIVAGIPDQDRPGCEAGDVVAGVEIMVDRRAAITAALASARPSDVVVVAGKGHERTQTIGDRVIDFDDRAVIIEAARDVLGVTP
jgi:UDP-N-acetylmuramoyl-L-alanyl-D-glutamate--2,6-diaminopimelate ligase